MSESAFDKPDVVQRICNGEDLGTLISTQPDKIAEMPVEEPVTGT